MEIILATFVIKFCPGCGKPFTLGKWGVADYFNRATMSCTCGVRVQLVNQEHAVEAATKSGGDLAESVRRYG